MVIHQTVHGYRRGHQLLASSTTLDPRDEDLSKRLSDLSGALTDEADFQPYLTAYPLPSGRFYAIARTWPDHKASRSGCVVTHTLLLEPETWATLREPSCLDSLFLCLQDDNVSSYLKPIDVPDCECRAMCATEASPPALAVEFVSRYFEEGLRPLVWFGEDRPERIAWRVLRAAWPKLRARLACCTLSLQPRTLEDRPFDLMFAPVGAYARFHDYSRQHILGGSSSNGGMSQSSRTPERWCTAWAEFLFDPNAGPLFEHELGDLLSFLDEDPSSIRRLFLLQDYLCRSESSPATRVGVLDLVEAIAPDTDSAAEYKTGVALNAVAAAKTLPCDESLKCLLLVSTRLDRPAYKCVNKSVLATLTQAVSLCTRKNAADALGAGESLFARNRKATGSAFVEGVLCGLRSLSRSSPAKLAVLRQFPSIAPFVLEQEPRIAVGFLRGIRQDFSSDSGARNDLVEWITSLEASDGYTALRNALLPELRRGEDAHIASELLKVLCPEDVAKVLDALSEATEQFTDNDIRVIAEDRVARIHPQQTRFWATQKSRWSPGIASIVAASYSPDGSGLDDLLGDSTWDSQRKSLVLAAFLAMISRGQFPSWFLDRSRCDPAVLVQLLAGGPDVGTEVSREVTRVLDEARSIPIAEALSLAPLIGSFSQCPFYGRLTDVAMQSAIGGFVAGSIPWETCAAWHGTSWASRWMDQTARWVLQPFLVQTGYRDAAADLRAWRWLAEAPGSLYSRRPAILPELLGALSARQQSHWPDQVTTFWVAILHRATSEATDETALTLRAQALGFAFEHSTRPLNPLVVETFVSVYEDVTGNSPHTAATEDLFGTFDWDRGKQLRKRLVDTFLNCDWSPGDLAMAVKDVPLLRKVFRRVMRKWRGAKYVTSMLKDLHSRPGPEAARVYVDLAALAHNPDFYEPWD